MADYGRWFERCGQWPSVHESALSLVYNQGIVADSDLKVVEIKCIRVSSFALSIEILSGHRGGLRTGELKEVPSYTGNKTVEFRIRYQWSNRQQGIVVYCGRWFERVCRQILYISGYSFA
jgi:hypothetical protein